MTGAPDAGALRAALVGRPVVAVGADVADIDRVAAVCRRRPRFVERVFTVDEAAYARSARDPGERFAARFAAKEAVLKALGVGLGGADFTDIEVRKAPSGAPSLHLGGRAAELAADLGIGDWLITLSHSEQVAYAVVVGLADARDDAAG